MKRTKEGRVKDQINDILKAYAPHVWYRMPVQNGMGQPTLDYYGCVNGMFFLIEAKADWDKLTARQQQTEREAQAAGGKVFQIRAENDPMLNELDHWLHAHVMEAVRRGIRIGRPA